MTRKENVIRRAPGVVALFTSVLFLAAACGGDSTGSTPTTGSSAVSSSPGPAGEAGKPFDKASCAKDRADLSGAGATFPQPVYDQWIRDYNGICPDVTIAYQAVGSGAGIQQYTSKSVDFGASDRPMRDDEIAKVAGGKVLHVPTVLGGIVLAYNLSGVSELKLTSDDVCQIYLGKITSWSDPQLAKSNPGLPNRPIVSAHRSDASGTSSAFTTWLSATCADWKNGPGAGQDWKAPGGVGGKGNPGVADAVKQNPGGIGYVELNYAQTNNIAFAQVLNKAGSFVRCTSDSVAAAFASLSYPSDLRFTNENPDGANAYPVVTATWLLVSPRYSDKDKGQALKGFLHFVHSSDSQAKAAGLGYAPLPGALLSKAEAAVDSVTVG